MSKWMEELKKGQAEIPELESSPCHDDKCWLYAWRKWELDRLIAIVERAENNGSGGFSYYYCSVCKCPLSKKFEGAPTVYDLLGHDNDCPYSDEYKGG